MADQMEQIILKVRVKNMKKKIKLIITVIISLLMVLFIGFSGFIGVQVFAGSTQLTTNEGTKGASDSMLKKYGIDYEKFCDQYKVEELKITSSFDQHIIPADYIYAENSENNKDNPTIILVHGLGGNRYSNYPLAQFFLEKEYNVITYDQRASNENTAKYTTFGYWEKYDLIDCLNYAKEQAPNQKILIWGASFGGATAGLALGYEGIEEKVDGLILDCPVSSMEWMIGQEMKAMDAGIPTEYMTWCGNIVNKMKLGFTYKDADVAESMKVVKIPILIINSELDTVTPNFMGADIYDAVQGENKEIWTVNDSQHCEIWIDHNQMYREKLDNFLKNIDK